MTPKGYAFATVLGWLLIVGGLADLAGRWVWGPGIGLYLLTGVGWRKVAQIAWLGVQRMEDWEK